MGTLLKGNQAVGKRSRLSSPYPVVCSRLTRETGACCWRLGLVREAGLEPAHLLQYRILSPGRLPIPPLPQEKAAGAKSNIGVPGGQAARQTIC